MSKYIKYLDVIKKYDCKLKDGKIFTKDGIDTKMILENAMQLEEKLGYFNASNKAEALEELLSIFENELKMRNEVLTNV
jgi:hypothetical protein